MSDTHNTNFHFIPVAVQDLILREIESKELKQSDVALTYSWAIQNRADEPIDFGIINRAIMARWSKSGLIAVKRQAWKLVKEEPK